METRPEDLELPEREDNPDDAQPDHDDSVLANGLDHGETDKD